MPPFLSSRIAVPPILRKELEKRSKKEYKRHMKETVRQCVKDMCLSQIGWGYRPPLPWFGPEERPLDSILLLPCASRVPTDEPVPVGKAIYLALYSGVQHNDD